MATVRLTLLKSLFLEDVPFFGELMAEHANHVFPGREDFILFLEEADAQKRIKLAKRLLSRLARESGIFVPFGLILSLLRAEEQYAPSTATAQYVPQDHFCHLVQLYLLGIYLFTHHKKLHRSVTGYFKRRRETLTHACSLSSEETAFFDFLFAWRSFVLLHDIGYPCELPPQQGNTLLAEIRTGYTDLRDMVCDETALAFLSRMIAWELLEEQCSRATCGAVAPNLFHAEARGAGLSDLLPGMAEALHVPTMNRWRAAERIPFLHGRRFASLSAHMRPTGEVLALLVHRRSGEPSLALIPDGKGSHTVANLQNKVKLSAQELRHHAFELGTTPRVSIKSEEYEWQMFLTNYAAHKSSLANAIAGLVNSHFTPELLHNASDALAQDAPDPLTTITSESDFLAYEHWVYEALQNWWQGIKQAPTPDGTVEHGVVSLCAISVEREISEHISGYIKRKIDATMTAAPPTDRDGILKLGIPAIVEHALNPVLTSDTIRDDITRFVEAQLHSRIESEMAKRHLFDDAKTISKRVYAFQSPAADGTDLAAEGALLSTLIDRLRGVSAQGQAVDLLLKESGLPALETLLAAYHPDYLSPCSLDHGLASAVCSLQVTRFAEDLLMTCQRGGVSPEDQALRAFTAISVCLGDEIDIDDLTYRAHTLMPEVTRAIAVHNLYPKHLATLKHASFRANLRREPFCFFAMLCDALQSWDRDRRLWQSESHLQYKTSGDHYDIKIVGDVIHVREHDYGLDVAKRAEALKTGLESYLHGVKDYIWLDLAQWPEEAQQPSRGYRSARVDAGRSEPHS